MMRPEILHVSRINNSVDGMKYGKIDNSTVSKTFQRPLV